MFPRTITRSCFSFLLALAFAHSVAAFENSIHAIVTTEGVVTDPVQAKGYQQFQVLNLLLDTLVRKDPEHGLVSCLAKSWTLSDDKKSYTFIIDPRSKFQNGEPVTAADVVFSIKRHLEVKSGSVIGSYLAPILQEVKSLDNSTVQFLLKGPYPPFLEMMSMSGFGIISKKSTEKNIIGSGPYTLEDKEKSPTCLVRSKAYALPKPNVDRFCFTVERDVEKTVSAFTSGKVNLAMGSPLEVALSPSLDKNYVASPTFSLVSTIIFINHDRAYWKNIEHRRHVSNVLRGVRSQSGFLTRFDAALDTFMPRGVMKPAYYESRKFSEVKKVSPRQKIKIVFPYGILLESSVKAAVLGLEAAGYEVEYLNVKGKELLDPIQSGDFDLLMIPYQGIISDPDGYLDLINPKSLMGKASIPSEKLLAELDHCRFEADASKRLDCYAAALKRWEEGSHVIPFSQNAIPLVHQSKLKLPNLNNTFHLNLREIAIE